MRFTRPPGSTELLLVRHGESEAMVPGRPFPLVDGHGDPALAPDGRHPGRARRRPPGQPPDRRHLRHDAAAHRADGGAARRQARPRPDRRARPARGPPRRVGGRALPQAHGRGPSGRPEGAQRAALGRHPGRRVGRGDPHPGPRRPRAHRRRQRRPAASAIFSHGGIIGEILAQVTESARPFAFLGADNASISHVVVFGDRWIVRRFNDTSHLARRPRSRARPRPGPGPPGS